MTDALIDRAIAMGYLSAGGYISIDIDTPDDARFQQYGVELRSNVTEHLAERFTVTVEIKRHKAPAASEDDDDTDDQVKPTVLPAKADDDIAGDDDAEDKPDVDDTDDVDDAADDDDEKGSASLHSDDADDDADSADDTEESDNDSGDTDSDSEKYDDDMDDENDSELSLIHILLGPNYLLKRNEEILQQQQSKAVPIRNGQQLAQMDGLLITGWKPTDYLWQLQRLGPALQQALPRLSVLGIAAGAVCLSRQNYCAVMDCDITPVSYTHLDVYKRQVIGQRNYTA